MKNRFDELLRKLRRDIAMETRAERAKRYYQPYIDLFYKAESISRSHGKDERVIPR